MIITVTLNPAIDQIIVIHQFVPGDTNRIQKSRFDPGGKGVNVSRVLHELGGESLAMGFAPGALGRYIEESLLDQGIPCDFLHTRGQTRTNITIVDEEKSEQTILSNRGPLTDERHVQRLFNRIRRHLSPGTWVVIAGSVPPPMPPSIYGDLVRMCRAAGAYTVVDADGELLEKAIAAAPYLVKANHREISRLVHHEVDSERSMLEEAERIHDQGVKYTVITHGKEGAVAVGDEGWWRVIPPSLPVISAMGAGDAMLAGIVFVLSCGGSFEEALRLGAAAGAATCLNVTKGTPLCHREDVERLAPLVRIEQIDRVPAGA